MGNQRCIKYGIGILVIIVFTYVLSNYHVALNFILRRWDITVESIFNSDRAFLFIVLLTVIMVLLNEIRNARKDSDSIFLRTIPGLKAVE